MQQEKKIKNQLETELAAKAEKNISREVGSRQQLY
jgi:hypothetical protein